MSPWAVGRHRDGADLALVACGTEVAEGSEPGSELAQMVPAIYSSPVHITTGSPHRGGNAGRGRLAAVVGAVILALGAVIGVVRSVDDEPEPARSGAQSGPKIRHVWVQGTRAGPRLL